MSDVREAVIISAVRTPVGKFQGSLKDFKATDLGALVVRESVKRAGVKPEEVDEVIMGCVVQAGLGHNPARQAALRGGSSQKPMLPAGMAPARRGAWRGWNSTVLEPTIVRPSCWTWTR